MRTSRFSDEQILAIVREAEGGKLPEVCRRHGISRETLRRWRANDRGLKLREARRLKKLVADQALDLSLMKDLVGRKG